MDLAECVRFTWSQPRLVIQRIENICEDQDCHNSTHLEKMKNGSGLKHVVYRDSGENLFAAGFGFTVWVLEVAKMDV